MDDKKLYSIKIEKEKDNKKITETKSFSFGFQTNPILQKMLLSNLNNKKGKFSFKDLFK